MDETNDADTEAETTEENAHRTQEERADETETAPVLNDPIDAAAGAATAALPEAWANRSYREYLTGTSVAVGDALHTRDLPLPWAVLVAPEDVAPENHTG